MRNFKITVTNTFHNTEATMLIKEGYMGHLQTTHLHNKLCPLAGCDCGGAFGECATAPVDANGNTYRFSMYVDGSAQVILEKRESDLN